MRQRCSVLAVLAAIAVLPAGHVFASPPRGGTPWAWGYNNDGELGNGTTTPYHGVAWPGPVANLIDVVSVAGGNQHTLAITADGHVWAWGDNGWGQLGQGSYYPSQSTIPIVIAGLPAIVAIAAGYNHNLALAPDGSVWAWGFNYYGQVGDGTSGNNIIAPRKVVGLTGIVAIAAGLDTSYALKSDGTVWAWGYDGLGQLGNGGADENPHPIPSVVQNLAGVTVIGAGAQHALAVLSNGSLWTWGDNRRSQLGAPSASSCSTYGFPCSVVPIRVNGIGAPVQVTGGYEFSIALLADGTVWGWGDNGYGQLAKGTTNPIGGDAPAPSQLQRIVAIAAGYSHTVALDSNGLVWTAGENDDGQLGNATFTSSSTPILALNVSNVSAIGSGTNHSLAIVAPPSTGTSGVSPLPAGWNDADVGAVGAAGSASFSNGTFTARGSGADVWGTADAFNYTYVPLSGDGTIVARVATISNEANWVKAGVMIRGSLSPSSAQAFMLVSWAKGVAFQRRVADSDTSVSTPGTFSTAPHWVKLVRAGNLITAYESSDGSSWTVVGSDSFTMDTNAFIGLAVSSHVAGTLATATFDNVTSSAAPSPNQPPTVSLTHPSDLAGFTAPTTIAIAATASDNDGTVTKVDFYANSTLLGTSTAAPYTFAWSNIAAGTYVLTAVATDNLGATTRSRPVTITVNAAAGPTLPPGWTDADVGAVGAAGGASSSYGIFTVQGAGADVWGTADAFNYTYLPLSGDGTIVAHVATISNEANWVKAGVMIRESLSPSSAQAFMLVSWAKGVAFQRRVADGDMSVSTPGTVSTAPRWVRLVRVGNQISAFESPDGYSWTVVGSDSFAIGTNAFIGLAVSSHVSGTLATATFDQVTVTQK